MGKGESIILTFHSLDASGSVISITPEVFRAQMKTLRELGVPVVPLGRAVSTSGSVSLTFDDGYRNFREHALPVLADAGFPSTVFVATGYCGRTSAWTSGSERAPTLPLMGWSELRELADSGVEVAAHSSKHVDLRTLSDSGLIEDLATCREQLEDRIGKPATSFAYPYGASDTRVRRFASERFTLACGTRLRFVRPDSDPFDLPRLDVYYLRDPRRFRRVLEGRGNTYITLRRLLREARACLSP